MKFNAMVKNGNHKIERYTCQEFWYVYSKQDNDY
jgi:hypothetical protein